MASLIISKFHPFVCILLLSTLALAHTSQETLLSTIRKSPTFSIFSTLLLRSTPLTARQLEDNTTSSTIFVPTNRALREFTSFVTQSKITSNKQTFQILNDIFSEDHPSTSFSLNDFIKYHIVVGAQTLQQFDGKFVNSSSGHVLGFFKNELIDHDMSTNVHFIQKDIACSNGFLNIISFPLLQTQLSVLQKSFQRPTTLTMETIKQISESSPIPEVSDPFTISPTPSPVQETESTSANIGLIVGIVVGAVILIVIISVIVYAVIRRRNNYF